MDKERFSLLLLEPGEIYFEDFSVVLLPFKSTKAQDGRLKLCSKSIVFSPKDILCPLLKIPLKDCIKIEDVKEGLLLNHGGKSGICVTCKQHVRMLEGNIVAPYSFVFEKHQFQFILNYANVSNCLAQIAQLYRASTLPLVEQNTMLAAITFSRQSRTGFDALWLEDLYEQHVLETQGSKVSPLVVNPGHILLTVSGLYYQPFNNVEPHPVLRVRLTDVRRVVKRRFLLQQVGLEFYCCSGSAVPHLYLALKSVQDRDALYDGVMSQSCLNLEDMRQEAVTLQWQHGVLSNYEYLLYLNSLADRTFNDLTQYPVFPWIVTDYTSKVLQLDKFKIYRELHKPIGALNDERFDKLRARYDEMPDPKFLYGSHYSTPGFVLFYLVRKFPHYMLCLQNGRFDHPDRMFNSVADVWRNVLSNSSDFKELVPEFYDIENEGDFLVNSYGINFGYRHDGSKIGDVILPPWAKGPSDFVRKLRDALESEHVSQNLHMWIDLIFGYKQTGNDALKAKNVFFHLCYEGSVDLATVTDPSKRHALEVQIMEFGQIPKQIFNRPHPKRLVNSPFLGILGAGDENLDESKETSIAHVGTDLILSKFKSYTGHREGVRALSISEGINSVASVGNDGFLKVHSLVEHTLLLNVALNSAPLSGVVHLPGGHRIAVGSFDDSVVVYDMQFGRVLDRLVAHENAITCIDFSGHDNATSVLVTGSWDCSARVWRKLCITDCDWKTIEYRESLAAELDHDSRIICLKISRDSRYLVTGCEDGGLFVWNLETHSLHLSLDGHHGAVSALAVGGEAHQVVSCGLSDKTFKIFDIASGIPVCTKTVSEDLRCIAWSGSFLFLGTSVGILQIWDILKVQQLQSILAHDGPVSSLAVAEDCSVVVSGGEDRQIVIWVPKENMEER